MADNPTPVEVTNVVETKPVTEPVKPPTVEKTTETKETTTVTGPPIQPPPPAVVADDWPREILAAIVILQFLILIGYIIYSNIQMNPTTTLIIGAEIGFVTTVLNYYFGSSSGSTQKSSLLNKVEKG